MRFFRQQRTATDYYEWFAWYPVWCWEGKNEAMENRIGLVWLETVLRRRNDSESLCKYRNVLLAKQKTKAWWEEKKSNPE